MFRVGLQLVFIFIIVSITCLVCEISENGLKNVHHDIPEPKVTSSNVSFCPTSSPKPKDIQLTVTADKENIWEAETRDLLASTIQLID